MTIKEQRKLCLSTAEQLVQSQHWAEAVKLFEKAEALGKPGQSLDRELASAYAVNGQFPQSIDRYQKLLAKNLIMLDLGQQQLSPGQSAATVRREAPPWVMVKRANVALKGPN